MSSVLRIGSVSTNSNINRSHTKLISELMAVGTFDRLILVYLMESRTATISLRVVDKPITMIANLYL